MQTDSKNHETPDDVKRVLPAVSIEEAAEIIQALYYYGRIHTVHGLIYGESHERYLSRAMTWLHFYRSSKNGSNGLQLPEGGEFETKTCGSLPLIEIKGEWYDAGLIKKVSRSGNYTNVWIGQISGCPKQVWDENSELLNRILAVRQCNVVGRSEQLPCHHCGQLEPCAGNSPETCYHPKVC